MLRVTRKVEFNHLPELAACLDRKKQEVIDWGMQRFTELLKEMCPVDPEEVYASALNPWMDFYPGMMRDLIRPVQESPTKFRIEFGAYYSIFVVFGTRYMAGNGFIWAASAIFEVELDAKVTEMVKTCITETCRP